MESLARKYWKDKDKIAKLTSYGSYLDCEFITAKYPEDESHIVGDLAEYVYDLEQEIEEQEEHITKLKDANGSLSELLGMKDKTFFVIEINEFHKQQNQTAIAELEKVKELMRKKVDKIDSPEIKLSMRQFNFTIFNAIDQQIKSLKGDNYVKNSN